jgi:hypothetical protein
MSGSRVRWWARRLTIGSEYVLPRRFLGPPVASPASGFPGRKRSERAVAGGPLRRLQGANARDSPSRCAPEPGGANTRRVTLAGCAEVPPWRKRLGLTFCAAVQKASGASALGLPFRKAVGTGLGASASVQTGPRRKRLGPGQPRRKRLGFRSAGDRLPGGRSLSFVGPVRACWPRRKRLGQSWFASRVRGRGANASTFPPLRNGRSSDGAQAPCLSFDRRCSGLPAERERSVLDPGHGCSGGFRGASTSVLPGGRTRILETRGLELVAQTLRLDRGYRRCGCTRSLGRLPVGEPGPLTTSGPRGPGLRAGSVRAPKGSDFTCPAPSGGATARPEGLADRPPWAAVLLEGPGPGSLGPSLHSGEPKPSGGRQRSSRGSSALRYR